MTNSDPIDPVLGAALARLGSRVLAGLVGLEETFRRLHPPDLPRLRARLGPIREALEQSIRAFEAIPPPDALAAFHAELLAAGAMTRDALGGLSEPPTPGEEMSRVLGAMHQFARAQALTYPLRFALPPISDFFLEEALRGLPGEGGQRFEGADSDAVSGIEVGLFRGGDAGARGGFDLYVPESWDGREALPLVIALHGGSGHGADFLWSWLREARSRRCLLLAPTSSGTTWSLHVPPIDGDAIRRMVSFVQERWVVDETRLLLTGLSDGATMTLLIGLAEATPYTHLAPVSGVLHPHNFANGNLSRAKGRQIHLIHGALDWMFPIGLAREAASALREAGADLIFREVDDLSHTYPRERNAELLDWIGRTRSDAFPPA